MVWTDSFPEDEICGDLRRGSSLIGGPFNTQRSAIARELLELLEGVSKEILGIADEVDPCFI